MDSGLEGYLSRFATCNEDYQADVEEPVDFRDMRLGVNPSSLSVGDQLCMACCMHRRVMYEPVTIIKITRTGQIWVKGKGVWGRFTGEGIPITYKGQHRTQNLRLVRSAAEAALWRSESANMAIVEYLEDCRRNRVVPLTNIHVEDRERIVHLLRKYQEESA